MNVNEFKTLFWDYSRKISDHTSILVNSVCEQHGLTMLQIRILVEIKQQKYHTIGSLASRLNLAQANVSTMCKKLEGKGFLERVRDQGDERVVKVILSPNGNQAVEEVDQVLINRISASLEEKEEEAFEEIIRGLKKLHELLEAANQKN
ncbi:MarR family winged helix-turn-helix transcriptional regulator [Bacillus sp. B-jedd]|uniref:MarR family winged helix-turn-helix transcriptional regulator n=1 Tax=Bacillus sp. B-jedd TaxID=1476857 RepID=UPI0005155E82|nr:MarR family transcriptional regulator [Bacillus sp. B-jedd]CEG25489.1 MarR family transcriptional regulator [Bacillus sp. B-jedd]